MEEGDEEEDGEDHNEFILFWATRFVSFINDRNLKEN